MAGRASRGRAVGGRRRSWCSELVLVCSMVPVLAGCVGSVDRSEFDELVRARGGGLSGDLVVTGLDAIADRSGVDDLDDLDVLRITLTTTTVSYSVRSADFDDEVDGWTYLLNGDLLGPDPEPNLDDEEQTSVFAAASVDPDLIEEAIDRAIEETSVRRGWAQSASLFAEPSGFRLQVSITNERADETFVFAPDGTLVGVS
jgi:hypothetical protein